MSDKNHDIWIFRVKDMLDRIEKIETYIDGVQYGDFLKNDLLIDGLERNIEIIGEAAYHVPKNIKDHHSEIPWQQITGMRHRLAHDYGNTNKETLWAICTEDLSTLKMQLENTLEKYQGGLE